MTTRSISLPRLKTVAEAADLLRVSIKTIDRAIKAGELHVHRLGRQRRIAEDDLAAFLGARRR